MTPKTDLDLLREKSTEIVGELLTEIGMAHATGDREKENRATTKLAQVLRRTNGIADLLGRKRTLEQVENMTPKPHHFDEEKAVNPFSFSLNLAYNVPFHKAAESILEGQLFQNLPGSRLDIIAKEVNKLFGESAPPRRIFGLMEAKAEAIAKANEVLRHNLLYGTPAKQAMQDMKKEMGAWSKATGETIYRTQVSKAYSAGQWRQLDDPMIRTRVGAVKFEATPDRNVRPMHLAWDGFLGSPHDPIWEWITPPIHFNCRCALLLVPHDTLKRMGEIDARGNLKPQARHPIPVPNFGRRPNKNAYAQYGVA